MRVELKVPKLKFVPQIKGGYDVYSGTSRIYRIERIEGDKYRLYYVQNTDEMILIHGRSLLSVKQYCNNNRLWQVRKLLGNDNIELVTNE